MRASSAQLKKLERIKNRSDFLKIQSRGRKWTSHGLILQAMPNEKGAMRVGFTVSKKVDVSAVKRNRIKRRLHAAAADILPLYAQASCDYILVGRTLTATRPYASLLEDLKWCLGKIGYDKKEPESAAADA